AKAQQHQSRVRVLHLVLAGLTHLEFALMSDESRRNRRQIDWTFVAQRLELSSLLRLNTFQRRRSIQHESESWSKCVRVDAFVAGAERCADLRLLIFGTQHEMLSSALPQLCFCAREVAHVFVVSKVKR